MDFSPPGYTNQLQHLNDNVETSHRTAFSASIDIDILHKVELYLSFLVVESISSCFLCKHRQLERYILAFLVTP